MNNYQQLGKRGLVRTNNKRPKNSSTATQHRKERTHTHTHRVASTGSSWLVSDSDTRSIDASASPVISPAACRYSTRPRASRWSSLVRSLNRPTASMCGDRSTPVIRAEGNVCASFRVDSPVEQPTSRMSLGSGP